MPGGRGALGFHPPEKHLLGQLRIANPLGLITADTNPLRLTAKDAKGSAPLFPLMVFCLSVLLVSAAVFGTASNPLVGSVAVFAFLAADVAIVVASLLANLLPRGPGDEDAPD